MNGLALLESELGLAASVELNEVERAAFADIVTSLNKFETAEPEAHEELLRKGLQKNFSANGDANQTFYEEK